MSPLAAQQHALLSAIGMMPGMASDAPDLIAQQRLPTWAPGIYAYQNNISVLAPRALGAAYPVTAQLLGDDSFTAMARAFWRAHPPARGDLAQWGVDLHGFMAGSDQLAGEPWLADVARAEWALHSAATAADADQQPETLSLLVQRDPVQLGLQLAPGTTVLRSVWPVASIILAHQSDESDLAEAGRLLHAGVGEDVLVWRQGFKPRLRVCLPGEAALVSVLLGGYSLARALEAAPALDIASWLARAVPDALWIATHLSQGNP
jgi:hypothetical protein